MTVAVHCEAIKVAYRQTKDGMVVSFAIHPNDLPHELATAPIGTRVMLAVAEIVPEEQATPSPQSAGGVARAEALSAERRQEIARQGAAARWGSEMEERPGKVDTKDHVRSERGKAAYALQDEMQRAVSRSAILCDDPQFQDWLLAKQHPGWVWGECADHARYTADHLREELNVKSRSEIASDPRAYEAFLRLEQEYRMATGQAAEIR